MPGPVVDDYQAVIRIIRNLLAQLGFRNIEECVCQVSAAPGVVDTLAPETPAEQRDKDQLITGQALNSRITSQDDIDDMLA